MTDQSNRITVRLTDTQVQALRALGVINADVAMCVCGERYVPHDDRQKFCSDRCRSREHKRAGRGYYDDLVPA